MRLKDQVTNKELSKKLWDLGVKKDHLYSWWHVWEGSSGDDAGTDIVADYQHHNTHFLFPAYSVAELGEMLPKGCFTTKTESSEFPWRCEYKGGYGTIASGADNEADARAKMLVCLLENNLIN